MDSRFAIGIWLMYFVYVKQNGKIWPQKWAQIPVHIHNQKPKEENVIFKMKLSDKEKDLTLDQLQMTYPVPNQK